MRIFVTIFIIYTIVTLVDQQLKIVNAKKENHALQNKIEEVEKDNERLKATLESVASAEYLERAAREQLGLVRPGERVYINQPTQEAVTEDGDKQQ
jgi:cell division protein FtsL